MSAEVIQRKVGEGTVRQIIEKTKPAQDLSLKVARRATLVVGVGFRLLLCPGDDIALASSTGLHAVDSSHAQAVLPSKDLYKQDEIVWETTKES